METWSQYLSRSASTNCSRRRPANDSRWKSSSKSSKARWPPAHRTSISRPARRSSSGSRAISCPWTRPAPTAEWIERGARRRSCRRICANGWSASTKSISPTLRPQLGRFRVNVFQQRGDYVLALRLVKVVDAEFRRAQSAGRRPQDRGNAARHRPLAGATGSGKSTTLAAMVEHINQTARKHIITLEDPIEYLFTDRLAVIEQREVGLDTAFVRQRTEERAAAGSGRPRDRRNARPRRASPRRSARRTSAISSSPRCTPWMRPKACSASSNFFPAPIANPRASNSRTPCTR